MTEQMPDRRIPDQRISDQRLSDRRISNRRISALENVFRALFLLYTGLGACNLTYGKPVITVVMYAAFLLGGAVLLVRLGQWRRYIRMPLLVCAVLLLLSYAISCAANRAYITRLSFVYFILWTFYFLILYTQAQDRTADDTLRDFRLFTILFMIWVTALCLISLYMYFIGYASVYRDPNNADYEVASGFFAGRLWGAFQDPNYGSVMCCSTLAMCVYWGYRRRERWLRVLLGLDMAALLYYMALSDSRNGMVCLGVVCAVAVLFLWFGRSKSPAARMAAQCAVIAAVIFAVGLLLPKVIQLANNRLVQDTGAFAAVDRGYDISGSLESFSNRRLDVWRSAVELGLARPLTGVSFTGVVPYALEHLPGTYIVNNDYWIMNTLDSEIFNTFAAQGFPGVIVLAAWAVLALRVFVKNIRRAANGRRADTALMTAIVCELAVSALFQGVILYQVTPSAVLFWTTFGTLMTVLAQSGGEAAS